MDDEYFIFFVASVCSEDPRAEKVMEERVYSSLEQSDGYREMLGDAFHYCMPQHGQNGIIKGVGFGVIIDLRRIQKVVDAIVRGLYYSVRKKPLPPAVPIGNIMVNPTLDEGILRKIMSATPRGTSDGGFTVRILGFDNNEDAALVHITFYNRLVIFTGFGCLPRRSELDANYVRALPEDSAPCGSRRCTYSIRANLRPMLRCFFENGGQIVPS